MVQPESSTRTIAEKSGTAALRWQGAQGARTRSCTPRASKRPRRNQARACRIGGRCLPLRLSDG